MKDIIYKKKTTGDKTVILFEKCSVTLNGMKTPIKHKDLGYVIIPCIIRDKTFKKALIKLGASVTLMPISIYMSLSIGTHIDTSMTLHFIDYIIKCPYGKVGDVLVKIDTFIFIVDFFIYLEMFEDEDTLLILGQPLLLIGRCMIDLEDGTLTLKMYDEVVKLNVSV